MCSAALSRQRDIADSTSQMSKQEILTCLDATARWGNAAQIALSFKLQAYDFNAIIDCINLFEV
jgi:hypothetical protein